MVFVLLCPSMASASHRWDPCKPVKTKINGVKRELCVAMVVQTDGSWWVANRLREGETAAGALTIGDDRWELLEPAPCPNINAYHAKNEYGFDSRFGDYVCRYESANEAPPHAMHMGGLGRYISTHKMLLATDSIFVLSSLADSTSTVHCLHLYPACAETNPLLGKHPSDFAAYGLKLGLTAGWIGINHWWAHDNHGEPRQRLYTYWTAPLIFISAMDAKHNADLAERLSNARARVMR